MMTRRLRGFLCEGIDMAKSCVLSSLSGCGQLVSAMRKSEAHL